MAVDLGYWKREDLEKIGHLGFGKLNAYVGPDTIERFAKESACSPQLMQTICLYACLAASIKEALPTTQTQKPLVPTDLLKPILGMTAAAADFRSLVDVLDAGPKTRGTERKGERVSTAKLTADAVR